MSFIKKQTAGTWITFIALVLTIVSCIIYKINIAGDGYFKNAAVPSATQYAIIAIVLLVIALVLSQINTKGIVDKLIRIVTDAMRIVFPALSIAVAITLVSSRVQGFAFIYFSNEEVLQEVQTAANLSSAHGAIASIIAFAVTALVGMIAAFFTLKKKEA